MRRNTLTAIAMAALTALALPGTVDAQDAQPERGRIGQPGMARPGQDPAARILALRQELGLSESQVDQIGRIRATLEQTNAPLLAQLSAAREQMRAERPQLTPEQREQMRAQMQERRGAMRDSIEQMTPEQREEMRARMQERAGKVRQRAGAAARPGLPDELRTVMEQLQSNTHEAMQQIHSVLTEEQRQKLRELRPTRGQRGPAMQRLRRDGGEPGVRPGAPRGRTQGAARGSR